MSAPPARTSPSRRSSISSGLLEVPVGRDHHAMPPPLDGADVADREQEASCVPDAPAGVASAVGIPITGRGSLIKS